MFTLPFIWMAGSSVKVGHELYARQDSGLSIFPTWPIPQTIIPYIDQRYYERLTGPFQAPMLAAIEARIEEVGFVIPEELDPLIARQQIARGLYRRLRKTFPDRLWEGDDWGAVQD